MSWSEVTFTTGPAEAGKHHAEAAAGNTAVVAEAKATLLTALAHAELAGEGITHLLLKAAAGAGKSYALRQLIVAAAGSPGSRAVGVTAFTNNQIRPLAVGLAKELGRARVCLHLSQNAMDQLPPDVEQQVTVVTKAKDIPASCDVLVATAHKLKAPGEKGRIADAFGRGRGASPVPRAVRGRGVADAAPPVRRCRQARAGNRRRR